MSLLLEGPAKLCLCGVKVAAAGNGWQQGEGKGEEGGGMGFLHRHEIVLQVFPGKVLRESKLQGFASHNQLHRLHLVGQLSRSPKKRSDSHSKCAKLLF